MKCTSWNPYYKIFVHEGFFTTKVCFGNKVCALLVRQKEPASSRLQSGNDTTPPRRHTCEGFTNQAIIVWAIDNAFWKKIFIARSRTQSNRRTKNDRASAETGDFSWASGGSGANLVTREMSSQNTPHPLLLPTCPITACTRCKMECATSAASSQLAAEDGMGMMAIKTLRC